MNKIILAFFTVTIIFSCKQKKDEQPNESLTVDDHKISTTTTTNSDESEYQLVSKTVNDLYKNGIVENSTHKLEFLFYCSKESHAENLTAHLKHLNYTAEYQDGLEDLRNRKYVVQGYTTPLPINASTIFVWSKTMSQIAEKYHSKFDGWQVTGN